jgi:hypothetical protein
VGADDLEETVERALVELRATLRPSVGVGELEETAVRGPVELHATLVFWRHSAMFDDWSVSVGRLLCVDEEVFAKVAELRESRPDGCLALARDDWDAEAA